MLTVAPMFAHCANVLAVASNARYVLSDDSMMCEGFCNCTSTYLGMRVQVRNEENERYAEEVQPKFYHDSVSSKKEEHLRREKNLIHGIARRFNCVMLTKSSIKSIRDMSNQLDEILS